MAGVSRASFYRNWEGQEPDEAEMALRDVIQRLSVAHRCYGYRRITRLVKLAGLEVGAKTVRRVMREDNLLAVRQRKFRVTTNSDHPFAVYPNLAQYLQLTAVGLGSRFDLYPAAERVCLSNEAPPQTDEVYFR